MATAAAYVFLNKEFWLAETVDELLIYRKLINNYLIIDKCNFSYSGEYKYDTAWSHMIHMISIAVVKSAGEIWHSTISQNWQYSCCIPLYQL